MASPWIPEDDLLLKNAVEAGASLEALAKGAVRFSRKFTVRELRNRWHSLLYDPLISAEASARMAALQFNPNSTVRAAKRKLESVARMYYALRKKHCETSPRLDGQKDFGFVAFDSYERVRRDDVELDAIFQDKDVVDVSENLISESDYGDISDSLFNFANEDDLLLVDADGNHNAYRSVQDTEESQSVLVLDRSLGIPDDQLSLEIDLPSAANTNSIKHCDVETMECILNSEDPEIPFNDDVILPKKFTPLKLETTARKGGYLSLSYADLKNDKQERILMNRDENPAQSLLAAQMTGFDVLPIASTTQQPVSCGVKCESTDGAEENPDQCRTAQPTLTHPPFELLKSETLHACNALNLPLYAKACSPQQVTSVPEADSLMLNQEESESEDGVPSYSDVEAMILEMDLCPDDTDSCISSEVLRYQNEDTRRTIIRLEQCAQSCTQRTIASRGALAVLYGRHLKHYIRENEVILGRATDDMEVDIDLGREGPANKISRRQALIKIEEDGSFLLKNLGKSSVFLNGKEVPMGWSTRLGPSCLIEIGEMAFVFEINIKSVGQHLANATRNQKVNNVKFEWSEGVP